MGSRRTFLGVAASGVIALGGCTAIDDLQRDSPDRQVPMDWSPGPGTWPASTYDPANTRHNPNASPPGDSPVPVWEREFDAKPGSITVADGQIFVALDTEIHALDIADGTTRWTRQAKVSGSRLKYVAGRLYEISKKTITARTEKGRISWHRSLSRPIYDILDREGYVFATHRTPGYSTLHADTGEVVRERDREIKAPALINGTLVATNNTNGLFRLTKHRRTLGVDWEWEFEKPYQPDGWPIVSEEYVYLPAHELPGWNAPNGDGAISVLTPTGEQSELLQFSHTPSMLAADDDRLFAGTSPVIAGETGTTGVLKSFTKTGTPLWTLERDASVGPLLAADDMVIAGPLWNDEVSLTGLDAATGEVRWEWPVSDFVSFAAVGDTLFVGDGNRLVALR